MEILIDPCLIKKFFKKFYQIWKKNFFHDRNSVYLNGFWVDRFFKKNNITIDVNNGISTHLILGWLSWWFGDCFLAGSPSTLQSVSSTISISLVEFWRSLVELAIGTSRFSASCSTLSTTACGLPVFEGLCRLLGRLARDFVGCCRGLAASELSSSDSILISAGSDAIGAKAFLESDGEADGGWARGKLWLSAVLGVLGELWLELPRPRNFSSPVFTISIFFLGAGTGVRLLLWTRGVKCLLNNWNQFYF